MAMVGQTVEHRRRHLGVVEDGRPLPDGHLLVRFRCRGSLAQHQAGAGRKRADQV